MTVPDSLVTDPSLRECLQLASKLRMLCRQLLSVLQSQGPAGELSETASIERAKQQKLLNAYLTQLKVLHRAAFMSAREAKQTTTEARQEVDRLHLQLQNLYYEQRHLRGEIAACKDFPLVLFIPDILSFIYIVHNGLLTLLTGTAILPSHSYLRKSSYNCTQSMQRMTHTH